VKSALVAAAARRGIVLSAESVELQGMGLALSGVTLRLPDVPEVTMKAPEVDLAFDWQGSLQKVGVPSYELALKGDATDLAAHFSSWRGGPHLPFAFEASSGHLLWSGASSPAFGVEGIDVGLAFGTRGEGSVHLETKSLSVSVARATLGPWRAVLDTRTDETKLVMALDRSKPDGPPLVTFVERPTLGRIVSVTIPRVKASQIGIPGELIQSGADPEIELSLEGQVLPTGSPLTAHAALGLFGVPLPAWSGVAAPLDLSFEGAIAGDPTALMHIDPGTLTVSRMKSKMSGTVTIGKGGVSVEIDRHAAKGAKAQPGWLFDTRDWTDARDAAPAAKVPPPASASAAPSGKRR
jgi:hypothetical protein